MLRHRKSAACRRPPFQGDQLFLGIDLKNLPALCSKYQDLPGDQGFVNRKGADRSAVAFKAVFLWSVECGVEGVMTDDLLATMAQDDLPIIGLTDQVLLSQSSQELDEKRLIDQVKRPAGCAK